MLRAIPGTMVKVGIKALAPAGGRHQRDVCQDGEIPSIERARLIEDPSALSKQLDQDKDQQAGCEAGHGQQRVTYKAVGEFEVVKDAGKKENPAGEDQRRPPCKERQCASGASLDATRNAA